MPPPPPHDLRDALPLLADEPLLRWCLGEGATGDTTRAWWLASAASTPASPLLVRGADGAVQAVGWLAPPAEAPQEDQAADPGEAANSDQGGAAEAAFAALLDRLVAIGGDEAVERYLDCAEACDGLLPDLPCHSLSSVVARSDAALTALIARARQAAGDASGSAGLLVWMAGDAGQSALLAAGAAPAGEAWLPGLAVLAWWWPAG